MLNLSTKQAELEAIEAGISLAEIIKNTGEIPQESAFAKNFPKFSLNEALFILANSAGAGSQKELKDKIDEVLASLTVLKKTIEAQPEGFEKIILIPPAVEESPQFAQLSPEEVLNQLEAARLRVKAIQNLEWTKGFNLPETSPPAPTFYLAPHNPPEPAPIFETPAKILVQNGLTSEDGVPAENYSEKLQDTAFKQQLESEIQQTVLAEHLKNLLAQDLSGEIEKREWAEKLQDPEKKTLINFIAANFAQILTPQVLSATPENLPQIQEKISQNLKEKYNQDRESYEEFLAAVFLQNPNFAEVDFRQIAIGQTAETILQTLTNFKAETVKVNLDFSKPKFTISFYKLINNNPVEQDLDYYIVPKTPAELETDYNLTKTEFETLIKVALVQTKAKATLAGG